MKKPARAALLAATTLTLTAAVGITSSFAAHSPPTVEPAAALGPDCNVEMTARDVTLGTHAVQRQNLVANFIGSTCFLDGEYPAARLSKGRIAFDVPLTSEADEGGLKLYAGQHAWNPENAPPTANRYAGWWDVSLVLRNPESGKTRPTGHGTVFRLRRIAGIFGTTAGSDAVRKGATITLTGRLRRADWQTRTYRAYSRQVGHLQFRTPTGTYRTVKRVTSTPTGALSAQATATVDGCFRLAFAGTSSTARAKGKELCIDVR